MSPDPWDAPDGQTQFCAECERRQGEIDRLRARVAALEAALREVRPLIAEGNDEDFDALLADALPPVEGSEP